MLEEIKSKENRIINPPFNSSSLPGCSHSQKASMDQGSTGANNVDTVPSPAGGARHRASSVCSPQLLSLKGSLLCQLGSEEGEGSHCSNGRNQPVNVCGAHSACSDCPASHAITKHLVVKWNEKPETRMQQRQLIQKCLILEICDNL